MTTTTPDVEAVDVRAADGTALRLRPIRPDDAAGLVAFHSRLSPTTTYYRFFGVHPRLSDEEVDWFTHVDSRRRVALVAVDGDRIVGVGRFDRLPGTRDAEVAFVVEDAYQHRGICPLLLRYLAQLGAARGIERFRAEVLAGNHRMLAVFRHCGYQESAHLSGDTVDVVLRLDATTTTGGAPWP